MCNPPFYASSSELTASAKSKSRPPYSACTGAEIEMVTAGGEVAFVSRMIDESQQVKDRCQWFTSMLGKYSSLEILVQKLKDAGVDNWAVKDLIQGNKTKRWAIAWSWQDLRPNQVPCSLFSPRGKLPTRWYGRERLLADISLFRLRHEAVHHCSNIYSRFHPSTGSICLKRSQKT